MWQPPEARSEVDRLRRLATAIRKLKHKEIAAECSESLSLFVQELWHVVEPSTPLVLGWAFDAICEHLEAVTRGDITRLLINVPPGSMKSLLVNVFWPAWEWATGFSHYRYVSFSYSAHLTERDNHRFLLILQSERFRQLFPREIELDKAGETNVSNMRRGFKIATSVGGVGTGERGDRVLLDDPHNVKQAESETIRTGTVEWFATSMSNRLNDMTKSAIVVVMQRVHEDDVSGFILSKGLDYVHLMIPAEYEPDRHCVTEIGWQDPREVEGEIFWPERFPEGILAEQKRLMGPFGYAGQYQQAPTPKGGGIIKFEYWQDWNAETALKYGCNENEFPALDFILASADTAYTEKQENDYSAFTIWGVWTDHLRNKRVMLMRAWQDRLAFPDLVIKIAATTKKYAVDMLLIEAKASGISVAQELARHHADASFGVNLINPGAGDKVARAYSIQHLFAEGMVFAPLERSWAEMVASQCASFPKGKHDDLVDSTTQALRYLRDAGLLQRNVEVESEIYESKKHKPKPRPLYEV